jgi:hypothetical protein
VLQRGRSTPSSAYSRERQVRQSHGALGGEQWSSSSLSWACSRTVVVDGFIIRDPSSFPFDLNFPTTRSERPQSGDEGGLAAMTSNHSP